MPGQGCKKWREEGGLVIYGHAQRDVRLVGAMEVAAGRDGQIQLARRPQMLDAFAGLVGLIDGLDAVQTPFLEPTQSRAQQDWVGRQNRGCAMMATPCAAWIRSNASPGSGR